MEATLTSKGQLTLPKPLRDKLRLHPGDRLKFFIRDDGHVEMVPQKSPLSDLKGIVPPPVRGVTLEQMEQAISDGACGIDRD